MLDSVTATVDEATEVLNNVNQGLGKLNGILNFFSENSQWVKIALAVVGALVLAILVGTAIVLLRMAFGI